MSSNFNYGFDTNSYGISKNRNLDLLNNYTYVPSHSPLSYATTQNSLSSNNYSSNYDSKLSSNNNSKTSNVSSSNESSLLNSYNDASSLQYSNYDSNAPLKNQTNSTNNYNNGPSDPKEFIINNYFDHRYASYTPLSNSSEIKKQSTSPASSLLNDANKKLIKISNNISNIETSKPMLASLLMNNRRDSVNLDSYPSTPRSNLSTPPVSAEKLLSYSYYSNSNYDKTSEKLKDQSSNYRVGRYNTGEVSYSNLAGSINKDRKAKSINNLSSGVAGSLDTSRTNMGGVSSNQRESPLYQKIMNKLSELPDSLLMRKYTTNNSDQNSHKTSTPILNYEFDAKQNIVKSPLAVNQDSNLREKALNTITNKENIKQVVEQDSKNINNNDKENRRGKYKSMYVESSNYIEETLTNKSQETSSGDLITPNYFLENAKPNKSSAYNYEDYLYSEGDANDEKKSLNLQDLQKKSNKPILNYKSSLDSNYKYPEVENSKPKELINNNYTPISPSVLNNLDSRTHKRVNVTPNITEINRKDTNDSSSSSRPKENGKVRLSNGGKVLNTPNVYVKIFDSSSNDAKLKRYSNLIDLDTIENKDQFKQNGYLNNNGIMNNNVASINSPNSDKSNLNYYLMLSTV